MNHTEQQDLIPLGNRFRGFCPVVVDVETGGFNAGTDALLEVAAVLVSMNDARQLFCQRTVAAHVRPFEGANLDPASLEVNKIDPFHPLRIALPEEEALQKIFALVHKHVQQNQCTRAILVGHNAFFDLGFIKAAVVRTGIKNNPFHPFSNIDTVTLGALAYGQTVLSRIAVAANLDWETGSAHSAVYDAEKTAAIFCDVVNQWENRV